MIDPLRRAIGALREGPGPDACSGHPPERPFAEMAPTLKRVSAALRDAGVPHALTGAPALWARGGPSHGDDLDLLVRPADAERAAAALEAAGLRVVRPPEGWLLKAWDGDVLVDLITEPVGLDAAQAIGRAEEVRVLGLHVLALRPEDVLTSMLLARTDLWLDFEGLLRAVRMVRERVDWDEVRERTRESPYAVGFMAMTEALGLVDGAPGRPAPGGG